jgi:hypothetical protein
VAELTRAVQVPSTDAKGYMTSMRAGLADPYLTSIAADASRAIGTDSTISFIVDFDFGLSNGDGSSVLALHSDLSELNFFDDAGLL